jgi:hypothetical protein
MCEDFWNYGTTNYKGILNYVSIVGEARGKKILHIMTWFG